MSWRAVEMNRRVDSSRIKAYNFSIRISSNLMFLMALGLQGPALCRLVTQVKLVICAVPASLSESFSLHSVSSPFPCWAKA